MNFFWDKPHYYGVDKDTSDLFLAYEKALTDALHVFSAACDVGLSEEAYDKAAMRYKVALDEALHLRKQFLAHIATERL